MAQGSSVTTSVTPVRRQRPSVRAASWIASSSACAVGSLPCLATVRAAADHPTLEDRDGADRHLASRARLAGETEGLTHGLLVRHVPLCTTARLTRRSRAPGGPRSRVRRRGRSRPAHFGVSFSPDAAPVLAGEERLREPVVEEVPGEPLLEPRLAVRRRSRDRGASGGARRAGRRRSPRARSRAGPRSAGRRARGASGDTPRAGRAARRRSPSAGASSRGAAASPRAPRGRWSGAHWNGVHGLGTNGFTESVIRPIRPRRRAHGIMTSSRMRIASRAIPRTSSSVSVGSPHMKYSFTCCIPCEMAFSAACTIRSSVKSLFTTRRIRSVPASGAMVMERSPPVRHAARAAAGVMASTRSDDGLKVPPSWPMEAGERVEAGVVARVRPDEPDALPARDALPAPRRGGSRGPPRGRGAARSRRRRTGSPTGSRGRPR